MRPLTKSLYRAGLIGGAALALSLTPMNARGQQVSTQTNASAQATATGQQNTSPDYDRMDQFLNDHKNIDKDLRSNPSLITSKKYLDHHKDLRTFLNDHPQMQREFSQDRDYFARRGGRFDRDRNFTGRDQDRDRDANGQNAQNGTAANNDQDRDQERGQDRDRNGNGQNLGVRNGQSAQLDQFLDAHPQIEKDLTANPSLGNNKQYLDQHQDLRTFLNDHPDLREQLARNPNEFMQRERQFDARQAGTTQNPSSTTQQTANSRNQDQDRDRDARVGNSQNGVNNNPDRDQDRDRNFTGRDQDRNQNPNPDLRNREVARMDQFLDDHQQIDKDLTAKPSLINDQSYLAHHKDLQSFLNGNPQVREEFAENPNYFMRREERFDSREAAEGVDANANRNPSRTNSSNSSNSSNVTVNLTDKQSKQMDRFLDKHKDIDRDLSNNPSLCKNEKYLHQHKDLRNFLNKNPEVRTQLAGNSSYFVQRHERMEGHHAPVKGTKPVKPPAKTPIEQHETTTPAAPSH